MIKEKRVDVIHSMGRRILIVFYAGIFNSAAAFIAD